MRACTAARGGRWEMNRQIHQLLMLSHLGIRTKTLSRTHCVLRRRHTAVPRLTPRFVELKARRVTHSDLEVSAAYSVSSSTPATHTGASNSQGSGYISGLWRTEDRERMGWGRGRDGDVIGRRRRRSRGGGGGRCAPWWWYRGIVTLILVPFLACLLL